MSSPAQRKAGRTDSGAVGKSKLCEHLGWSRPTLDKRLKEDPNFPVLSFGSQAGGWQFDVAAVTRYLQGTVTLSATPPAPPPAAEPAPSEPRAAPSHAAARESASRAAHQGEVSATQRHKTLQSMILADKLKATRGELVQADLMRVCVGTMLAALGKSLDGLPDSIAKRLGLTQDQARVIGQMIEESRRGAVAELRPIYSEQ